MKVDKRNSEQWGESFKKMAQARKNKDLFETPGKVFASSAGLTCEQQTRYVFEGVERILTDPWHGKEAEVGNAVHTSIQKDLKFRMADKVDIEKVFPITVGGVIINCRIDAILNNMKVLEIKTCKDSEGKEYKNEHYEQLQFYLGVTGMKKGLLSYFKRSNGIHVTTFEIEFDEEIYKKVVDKFERVILGKDLKIDTESCNFCPYAHHCPSYVKKDAYSWKKKTKQSTPKS